MIGDGGCQPLSDGPHQRCCEHGEEPEEFAVALAAESENDNVQGKIDNGNEAEKAQQKDDSQQSQ